MKVYAKTHVGRVRSINQDAYYEPADGENFAVVADGMGGHKAGEVASQIAVEEFAKRLRPVPQPNEGAIRQAVSDANRAIYLKSIMDRDKAGMGTTLTGLWLNREAGEIYLAHVGDSRAYRLRNGKFVQVSRDHSLVEEMVERGEITPREARVHPHRHYITRALGTSAYVTPDVECLEARQGDIWLLCSDGLSNYFETEELGDLLLQGRSDWMHKVSFLVELALKRGGSDNITAMIIDPDGGAV